MITEKFLEKHSEYHIQFVANEIKSIKTQDYIKQSIRVFLNDKRLGIASALGYADEKELKLKAMENAKLGFTYDYDIETDVHYERNQGDHELLNEEFLNDYAKQLQDFLKPYHKYFVFNGALTGERVKRTIQNSEYMLLHSDRSEYSNWFNIKQIGNSGIIDGYFGFSSFFKMPLPKYIPYIDIILNALLQKEINVNLDDVEVAFIECNPLRKMGSDVNGEFYHQGNSLLAGRLNTQIMREDICINEVSDDCDLTIFVPFDHEGIIRNANVPIVKNGVLTHIAYDKKRAKKYDTKTTGNGFRSFETHPYIGMSPFIPEVTMKSLLEYSYEKTLLIPYMSSGGDFLSNGNFSFPVQLGFYLKDGKIIGKSPQLTLTGNYLEIMNQKLIGIAENDLFGELKQKPVIICNPKIKEN